MFSSADHYPGKVLKEGAGAVFLWDAMVTFEIEN